MCEPNCASPVRAYAQRQVEKSRPSFVLRHQVTYRVVQVTDDQLEASADGSGAVSVVSTAAFAGTPQAVAQVSKLDRGTAAGVSGRWWWRGNEADFKTNSCNPPRGKDPNFPQFHSKKEKKRKMPPDSG